ncbi:MAG: hypothetical protein ACREQ5_24800, partial [Candidatus Dormibacteria bacterium]
MANPNAPHGLNPVRYLNGANWNQQANLYRIPAADTTAYAIGDVVKSLAGCDAFGVPNVIIAAAGNTPRGVIVGVVV